MTDTWQSYSQATKGRPPRPFLARAVNHYVKERGIALDLGPGALSDSRYLIESGFRTVVAVNKDPPEKDPVVMEVVRSLPSARYFYIVSTFDRFGFMPEMYDLVNAQFSLPFNPAATFDRMFASLKTSLKKNGVLTGQFFGDKDSWNDGNPDMTFHTREQALALLSDLDICKFCTHDNDGITALGHKKHWHVFHFIARRR